MSHLTAEEAANSANLRVRSNFENGDRTPGSQDREVRKTAALESIALELNLLRKGTAELTVAVRNHR